jgi:hypothetical protein
VKETSFQNANPLKIKVSNDDSHDEIQFLESILIKETCHEKYVMGRIPLLRQGRPHFHHYYCPQ